MFVVQVVTAPIHYPLTRYGGQYSDLDTVSLLKTSHLENIVSVSGDFISNANIILAPRHPFVMALMRAANQKFTGKGWNSLGESEMTLLQPRILIVSIHPFQVQFWLQTHSHQFVGSRHDHVNTFLVIFTQKEQLDTKCI